MKILFYSDVHICEHSSIITQMGKKYSVRLEHCIDSLNWANEQAEKLKADLIVNCGDTFDRPDLTDMEITATRDIKPCKIPTLSIVGNHDSADSNLKFSSVNILSSADNEVISQPEKRDFGDFELCFLPYIIESNRKTLTDYFGARTKKRVIFSHNDIKGVQMGAIVSENGFSIEDIEKNCDLFIGGHIHNQAWFCKNGLFCGNLVGKDFGENALKYPHGVWLLDTDTLKLEFFENPYSFNFYKITIATKKDLEVLKKLKPNAVLSVNIKESLVKDFKYEGIYKLVLMHEQTDKPEENIEDLQIDYLKKFIEFCHTKIADSKYLRDELSIICGGSN